MVVERVVEALVPEHLRISSSISETGRPASVSARHATRMLTPSAASSGPWPQTSPISSCSSPDGSSTAS